MQKPVRRAIMTPNTESKINRMHRGQSCVSMIKDENEEKGELNKEEKLNKDLPKKLSNIKEVKEIREQKVVS